MILLCVWFESSKKKNSFLKALRTDLHPSKMILVMVYYFHFFMIWLSILILVGLSNTFPTKYLWIILAIIQILFHSLSLLRMFESWFMAFMNFYTECQISMFIIFASVNTFISNDSTRVRATTIYEFIYLGTMCVSVIILFINILVWMIIWICVNLKNKHTTTSSVVDVKREETQDETQVSGIRFWEEEKKDDLFDSIPEVTEPWNSIVNKRNFQQ